MSSKISIAFSPCPNDTFMLYHLLHDKLIGHVYWEPNIADVEELNKNVLARKSELTKLSFRTYYEVSEDYELLTAGGAMGRGNGPLFISKHPIDLASISDYKIAVPGLGTTAMFLMEFAFPKKLNVIPMLFSDIESAIINGEVDAGVIIHETRFMYAERGLICLADLGAVWEEKTGLPIPLGGFAIRKSFDPTLKVEVCKALRQSIAYAMSNYQETMPFVKHHAQELSDTVIKKHIEMFVNEFSLNLGDEGRKAVSFLFDTINKNSNFSKHPTFI